MGHGNGDHGSQIKEAMKAYPPPKNIVIPLSRVGDRAFSERKTFVKNIAPKDEHIVAPIAESVGQVKNLLKEKSSSTPVCVITTGIVPNMPRHSPNAFFVSINSLKTQWENKAVQKGVKL